MPHPQPPSARVSGERLQASKSLGARVDPDTPRVTVLSLRKARSAAENTKNPTGPGTPKRVAGHRLGASSRRHRGLAERASATPVETDRFSHFTSLADPSFSSGIDPLFPTPLFHSHPGRPDRAALTTARTTGGRAPKPSTLFARTLGPVRARILRRRARRLSARAPRRDHGDLGAPRAGAREGQAAAPPAAGQPRPGHARARRRLRRGARGS